MKKVLENIRSRPAHHRDRIVWICAAVAAAILLLAWALVGSGRKTKPDGNFFQTFQQGIDEGKNIVPAPDNTANTNQ